MSDQNNYWVITSRAKGDASNPFGGSATANQTSQLVQMTEDQIRKEYQDSGQLQDHFGSFDSYMTYIGESQDWVQSAEWMMANPEYEKGEREWLYNNREDVMYRPGERDELQNKIQTDISLARQNAYALWLNEGAELMDKWGLNRTIYNDDGDKFKWTGSGYQKTYKVDDHAGVGDYIKTAIVTGAALAATPALASALGGIGGAALPAGLAGPSAPLIGGKLATGLAAGATSAASQGLLTGSIDPKSVLTSAVMAGINPGGYVADNYVPWRKTDFFTGDKSWAFGGAPPSSFMGGLVSGTVNDLVSNGIMNGEIDLQGSLEKGLISGGLNSFKNAYDEYRLNSEENLADEYQFNNPDATREEALAWANSPINADRLNKTDLGALIGENGLLNFVPQLDTSGIRNTFDFIGNGVDGLLNGFELGDYSTMGLINNPVVNGATSLLGNLLPSGSGEPSDDFQAQWDQFSQEWYDNNSGNSDLIDSNGNPTVAGAIDKNQYVTTKIDNYDAFYYSNSGGLNENYSWSPNPRGESEVWGTLDGIDGTYSTGGVPISPMIGAGNSTISPILDADGNVTKPLNFGPEFTAPDYVQPGYSTNTVLSSNNDAALRNYGLISLVQDLTGDDDKNASSNSNASSNTTDLNAGETAVSKDETLAGADPNAGETVVSTGETLTDSQTVVSSTDELAGASSTDELASGSSAVLPGTPTGGRGGALTDWTDLYGYTKISPYKKARLKVLAGMLSGIPGVSMGSLALNFGSEKDPYQKIGRAVWDFGQERNA
jgi:hypothetical protein